MILLYMVRVLPKHTGSQGLQGTQSLMLTLTRLTIRPGLAGTVPVLRPCPGVPAGWSKCLGFVFFLEIT